MSEKLSVNVITYICESEYIYGGSCLCLHRCHCGSMNDVHDCTAAGEIVTGLVEIKSRSRDLSPQNRSTHFLRSIYAGPALRPEAGQVQARERSGPPSELLIQTHA